MKTKIIAAVVAGTGFDGREAVIRMYCREGALVQLRREPENEYDPDAIAVWMSCPMLFGLIKKWMQIGYIKAARADGLAKKIDSGELMVQSAVVRSFFAPRDKEHPRVSLEITATTSG